MLTFTIEGDSIILKKEINKGDEPNGKENSKNKSSEKKKNKKGEAADITVGSKSSNKKLFNMILQMIENDEITVGQLIDEKDYTWLHISLPYKRVNQILHLK